MTQTADHQPVMLLEAIDMLAIKPDHWYIDATFGRGGHTHALLQQHANVLAFDWDEAAINYGEETFASAIQNKQLILVRTNFTHLKEVIKQQLGETQPQGVLFDFGTTSDQLRSKERGFSFDGSGPLDMRMDSRLGVTAADLLAVLTEKELTKLFFELGGEPKARIIAKRIKSSGPKTTAELSLLIQQVKGPRRSHLHPATQVFQALRIAVNSELEQIEQVLPVAWNILAPGGRIVTLCFHEGEDRPIKQFFQTLESKQQGRLLTKRPLTPTETELQRNPRSRSTKLRAIEKIT